MKSCPLLFSSFDMPCGDEHDIPEATTFACWRDVANKVTNPNDSMVFEGSGLTRWGILNSLPYWGELKIHHLLDPMHIEGNVGKVIIKQLYGEKDNNFREAYEDLERHPDVWIIVDPNTGIEQRPSTPWTLITHERKNF